MSNQVNDDDVTTSWAKFLDYDFANDSKWNTYFSNLTFSEATPSTSIVRKYQRKYYSQNVSPLPNDLPTVPYQLDVIEPGDKHECTLIFMHGLGDTGSGGWLSTWRMIQKRYLPTMKVILPTALTKPVTLNGGMPMPAWYDIIGLSPDSKEDIQGIKSCSQNVHNMILNEMINTGLKSDKIFLGGFSQGGSMALYASFVNCRFKLAGIIGLSTWALCRQEQLESLSQQDSANRSTSFLMVHGKQDPIVRFAFGKVSYDAIADKLTGEKEFKEYDGLGHSTNQSEMEVVLQFIKHNIRDK